MCVCVVYIYIYIYILFIYIYIYTYIHAGPFINDQTFCGISIFKFFGTKEHISTPEIIASGMLSAKAMNFGVSALLLKAKLWF